MLFPRVRNALTRIVTITLNTPRLPYHILTILWMISPNKTEISKLRDNFRLSVYSFRRSNTIDITQKYVYVCVHSKIYNYNNLYKSINKKCNKC